MPAGICNKCGDAGELVLAGCVCAKCSDALDKYWAGSTATDWVLIATQGPTRPPLRAFVRRYPHWNSTYFDMKSAWATWSNGPHVHFTGLIGRDELEQMRSALGTVAERNRVPFIRPATQIEIADHERALRSNRAHEERTTIFRNWQFDPLGRSLLGTGDHNSWERRKLAIAEIRDKFGALDLREYAGLDVLRQHWGNDISDTSCESAKFFMIRDCPNCSKGNRIPGATPSPIPADVVRANSHFCRKVNQSKWMRYHSPRSWPKRGFPSLLTSGLRGAAPAYWPRRK